MATAPHPRHDKTFADVLALGDDAHVELIDGDIVPKAAPSFVHGETQGAVSVYLHQFRRQPPDGGPGWLFAVEVDTELTPRTVVRPDVAGWRRDRVTRAQLVGRPVRVIPDWVCEVLSPSNRAHDLVAKARLYHAAHVGHYWLLDPEEQVLQVFAWREDGYRIVLGAGSRELVRPEPFGAEVSVAALLGLDDEG